MRISLTTKLVAIMLALSLGPIGIISYVSINGINEVRSDVGILNTDCLAAVQEIANGTSDLAAAHESYMIYVLGYGTPEASRNLNDMVTSQASFRQFLTTYSTKYAFEVLPRLTEIVTSAGREELVALATSAYNTIHSNYDSYETTTLATQSLLAANLTTESYASAENASLYVETINNNMADLMSFYSESADLMDSVVRSSLQRSIFWTMTSVGAVAGAVVMVALVLSSRETKPIATVSRAVKTIAEGNFRTRLEIKTGDDEIGDLVKSMNLLIGNISEPLIELTESAQAIAAGDFSKDINVEGKGDMAKLVQAFKKMKFNLARLTDELRTASESLKESSSSLADTIGQMTQSTQHVSSSMTQASKGAQSEANRIDEMVKMLSEQTKAIYDVVQSAQNAAGASANASEVAQNGSKSAQNALERMSSLLRNVEDTADAMKLLSRKSKEISQIVSIITNISNQTNLLSLNAAIEAARAGEQGRGFAVVADEVRKLAEGSRKAASQIQQLIELVEHDIDDTTQKMEHTMADASESSRTISESLKSLEDIAATIEETAAMVEEISASTEEQKALTENIAKSLDEVATVARETASSAENVSVSSEELAAGMEELTASAHELADLAKKLNDITKQTEASDSHANLTKRNGGSP